MDSNIKHHRLYIPKFGTRRDGKIDKTTFTTAYVSDALYDCLLELAGSDKGVTEAMRIAAYAQTRRKDKTPWATQVSTAAERMLRQAKAEAEALQTLLAAENNQRWLM